MIELAQGRRELEYAMAMPIPRGAQMGRDYRVDQTHMQEDDDVDHAHG